ncbi:MAG: DUF2752 domain-containing protein [Ignavibacteria bacterium]|jgi:hypothetical protein|nr:DUF2752 domain-containing protein [Ignavibacteria bacterium]MCU7504867.1 DUF2752 domain-containing protein [Ignavibacteria bacterium]MCU7518321.1 DUF2752 domain-containing protein [Ignavibacteria bacterium]
MIQREFRQGLFTAWAVVSFVVLFILLAPVILPESTLLSLTPVCESKRLGLGQCPLCGMTRAFIEISRGNLNVAGSFNRQSVALYILLVLNQLVFLLFVIFRGKSFIRR